MSLSNTKTLAPAPATTRGAPTRVCLDAAGSMIVYATGNLVYLRSLDNPTAEVCDRHTTQVTCVSLSPNGNYCASGDKDGNVIVWATNNADKTEKLKTKPITGVINDIAWSDDGQRIAIVGEGKSSYGTVLLVDGGSSVGVISGHSKFILTCDFRKQRPYRVITGGTDSTLGWFEGPPFKFHHSVNEHQGNINITRFSPDGSIVASAGADKTILLLDGKTGDKVGKITTDHQGSIFSLAFTPNGQQIVTASGDKTCKVYRAVDNGECVSTCTFEDPTSIDYQQLGVAVSASKAVSVGLNGDISVLNLEGGPAAAIFSGHQRPITGLSYDPSTQTLVSTSSDGKAISWAHGTSASVIKGTNMKNIAGFVCNPLTGDIIMGGNDDSLIRVKPGGAGVAPLPKLSGGAVGCAVISGGASVVIATSNALFILNGESLGAPLKCPYGPSSVATFGTQVWVGGKDKSIHVYDASGSDLKEVKVITGRHNGAVTALAFSKDGSRVAAGDGNREIVIWDTTTMDNIKEFEGMVFHTTRINSLSFSPSGRYLVSGSVDSNVIVWNLENKLARLTAQGAHPGGVSSVTFTGSDHEFVSGGNDGAIRYWKIPDGW